MRPGATSRLLSMFGKYVCPFSLLAFSLARQTPKPVTNPLLAGRYSHNITALRLPVARPWPRAISYTARLARNSVLISAKLVSSLPSGRSTMGT